MEGFRPAGPAYRPVDHTHPNRRCELVSIGDVEPLTRNLSHGVFNDSIESGTARDRVVNIFKGFRSDAAIPPVEVVALAENGLYRYKLHHGAHRFYSAVAAGFTHVPAIIYQLADVAS